MSRTTTTLNVHDTPPEIWDALARLWPVNSHNTTAWICVPAEGVTLNFYAPRVTTTDATTAA